LLSAGVLGGCGGDNGPEVDPAVAPFVGTWDADSLAVTNDADTTVVANVLDFGSFFITVEPSGQYTATLTVNGSANPQIGQLTVNNANTLTLTPSFPSGEPPATSSYVFLSGDYVVLEGPTDFDFNLDGTPEPAQAYFGLQRR
jgi:hypothetical protein